MNSISQTIQDAWKSNRRTKLSPNGWISGNAVCCVHRGESVDKKGRGGLIVSGDSVSYSCFNCGFKANYTAGRPIYPKMQKLLQWLGISDRAIQLLKLETLRITTEEGIASSTIQIPRTVKPVDMPTSELLECVQSDWPKHVEFLKTRGFVPEDFPFLVSNDLGFQSRLIVPFIHRDCIIGYSARSIVAQQRQRYLMRCTMDYVFGLQFVEPEYEWIVVTEGIFDALSIKGLAVMHNEINDAQIEMICDTGKRIIVVPDLDSAGLSSRPHSLISAALDNDWNVAFPEWEMKDINAAYKEYGPLFCVAHILKTATSNQSSIKLRQRILLNQQKSKASLKSSLQ